METSNGPSDLSASRCKSEASNQRMQRRSRISGHGTTSSHCWLKWSDSALHQAEAGNPTHRLAILRHTPHVPQRECGKIPHGSARHLEPGPSGCCDSAIDGIAIDGIATGITLYHASWKRPIYT